jgi:glycosyltransferase involved in cell wall biosynthesis
MHVAHLLRKYNPSEWGGTETAIRQLCDGLRHHGVGSVVHCPRLMTEASGVADPLVDAGCVVKRFKTCVPVWGIAPERRRQMISVGGNLMSFDLFGALWKDREISVVHSHALGRLGGIGMTVARRKKVPFVVTIHGGVYDLPPEVKRGLNEHEGGGWEWGKLFGLILRSRRVLMDADAIVTCNPREAELIRQHHPDRHVMVQPHGVPAKLYQQDRRAAAREAFPWIEGRQVLLSVGRIDPVKNQRWLIEQMPGLLQRNPRAMLVLAGPCTDEAYGKAVEQMIERLGLGASVRLTGKLPPGDPRLIGLMQESQAVLLPSLSETFGLVLLEAWAAGTAVISSRTSGAKALVEQGENGWLFDLERPEEFHAGVQQTLGNPDWRTRSIAAGTRKVVSEYDATVLTARMKQLYEHLIDEKHALRYSA